MPLPGPASAPRDIRGAIPEAATRSSPSTPSFPPAKPRWSARWILLRHQVPEIEAAQLQPGEEEDVLARYAVAANSRRLLELSTAGVAAARRGRGCRAAAGWRNRSGICANWKSSIPPASAGADRIANAVLELEESRAALQQLRGGLELDPAQTGADGGARFALSKRSSANTAARWRKSCSSAKRPRRACARSSRAARNSPAWKARSRGARRTGRGRRKLAKLRAAAAPKLAARYPAATARSRLQEIGVYHSRCTHSRNPAASGFETREFLFAPNPGEPPKPLKRSPPAGKSPASCSP